MIEQRYLDAAEEFFVRDNGNDIFLATKFRGDIDIKALELAFNCLCRRHPMLCSRIRQVGNRYLLSFSTDHEPEFHVREADFSDILNRFEEPPRFCRSEYGFASNLGRVILAQKPGEGYVILGVHHSLYAGAGAWELPRHLWEIYTRIVEGDNVSESMGRLPPSPSQVLLERGITLGAGNGKKSKTLAGFKAEWDSERSCSQYLQLSEEETARILRAAKYNKVSVSGFILGSLVVALKHADRKVDAEELNVSTLMDMGQYVDPPVSALDTTYFATPVRIPVSTFGDVIDVGLEFEHNVRLRMREASTLRPLSAESVTFSNSLFRQPEVGFNNGGKIHKYSTPKGIEIENICLPFLMTSTAPMVQTELSPPNRRASVAVLTYNSKMTLILSGAVEIFEVFMREMSIQIGRYGVTLSELEAYES